MQRVSASYRGGSLRRRLRRAIVYVETRLVPRKRWMRHVVVGRREREVGHGGTEDKTLELSCSSRKVESNRLAAMLEQETHGARQALLHLGRRITTGSREPSRLCEG